MRFISIDPYCERNANAWVYGRGEFFIKGSFLVRSSPLALLRMGQDFFQRCLDQFELAL